MKNKYLVLFITLVMCFSLASCGVAGNNQGAAESETKYEETCKASFDADEYYKVLENCRDQIREKTDFKPEIIVTLGTGLGGFADAVDVECEIPYEDIEGFPVSTAPSHEGKLIFGTYAGKKLAIMKGRVHLYEGYSAYDVVRPIRVLHLLGADTLINTHATGSLNEEYRVGEFMVSDDLISSFIQSPLTGENIEELGDRFTGMTQLYDKELNDLAVKIGEEKGINVHRGVFIQTPGPQFETPAEIKMFRELGADTVGMSSGVEAIAARHMGMKICDINSITNMAAGMEDEELSEELINEASDMMTKDFVILLSELLEKMQ